ncbi:Bacteriophage HP1, Orf23 [uncultured Caudovirales phage]|uniref:Bacteriophage HP1, Orf23 n=1 Tax=uncultured Caudovirales phage TaxID=2100421 RepID=A0A6J5LN79_9CAUD|nr:Bacteriophage HP1, Orf23 [uncultured Caudovirales phage]CAB4168650.1 Bacteriophage HP1, Orf23 [uncultured Caudovirales phage]
MALNDIIFNKGQGGLGRPLAGEDYISGLIFYAADGYLPSGFSSNDRIKLVGSVQDAENLGILNDYSDGSSATFTLVFEDTGSTGDTVRIDYTNVDSSITTLANYTVQSSDTTIALQGQAITDAINGGTYVHGFSATFDGTDTILVTIPKSQGYYPSDNSPVYIYETGDIAFILAQPSGGTPSKFAVWHYHIAEYFRIQPKGSLYIGFFEFQMGNTFVEIQTMQVYSGGKIRQIGIYKDGSFYVGDLTTIQTVLNNLDGDHMPVSSVLYAGDLQGIGDLTTLPDLNPLTAPKVSAVISQDGAGQGAFLYKTNFKSITTLGATLGAVSLASVSEDIAWPVKFNISNGAECDTIAFANGVLASTVSKNNQETLDNRRYIFLLKYVGLAGSYFNDSHTAVAVNSDYAYIENNRTIDKAIRNVYAAMIAYINSPLVLNTDGTLSDTTVAFFESLANTSLDEMVRATELSGKSVVIDPTQNVLSTGNITITVKLLPVGVARQITVNIGFTTSL